MSSEPKLPPAGGGAHDQPHAPDEIDDLFNLGEASSGFREELEAALTAVDHAKQELAAGATAATTPPPAPRSQPAPSASAPVAAAAPAVAPAPVVASSSPNKLSAARVTFALVALLVVINTLVIVFMSRSNSSLADAVASMGSTRVATPPPPVAPQAEPTSATAAARPEGYHALGLAQSEIARSEHAFARRRLFSLLAVVDGIQEPARADIEARAGMAVGDSYRLQAEASTRGANGGER